MDSRTDIYAVTPGEMKAQGAGLTIRYGVHPSPFGVCFVATIDQRICALSFPPEGGVEERVEALRQRWRKAILVEDEQIAKQMANRIFVPSRRRGDPLPSVVVRGTPFQVKVWEALVRIPPGSTASYEEIAARIDAPGAVRAVGNAVAGNAVAFLIPCHRVIRKTGALGNYRWGSDKKQAMLAWEADRV